MKDYFANNRSFVDLIPSNLRDETNTSLMENLFDRFLTKDESIPMFGYVGKNTVSDPIQRLPQMDLDREINQLISTYVFSTGSTSHYFTPHDFFLKLKDLGVRDPSEWLMSKGNNYLPPINLEKFVNFYEYYWVANAITNTPTMSWNGTCAPEYYTIAKPAVSDKKKLNVKAVISEMNSLTGSGYFDLDFVVEFTSAREFTISAIGNTFGLVDGSAQSFILSEPPVNFDQQTLTQSFEFVSGSDVLLTVVFTRELVQETTNYYQTFYTGDKFTIKSKFIDSTFSVNFNGASGDLRRGGISSVRTLSKFQTVDGVQLRDGDRVLVVVGSSTGIFEVSRGQWSKTADSKNNNGDFVFCENGETFANHVFKFTSSQWLDQGVSTPVTNDWQENNFWVHKSVFDEPHSYDLSKVEQARRPIVEFWDGIQLNSQVDNFNYVQRKTQFNQLPLFDLFEYDGTPSGLISPIFFYVESPDSDVDLLLQRRVKKTTSEDFVFDHGLFHDDSLKFYKHNDEIKTIWHPGATASTIINQTFSGQGNGILSIVSKAAQQQQILTITCVSNNTFEIRSSKYHEVIQQVVVGQQFDNFICAGIISNGDIAFKIGDVFMVMISGKEQTRSMQIISENAVGSISEDAELKYPRMFTHNPLNVNSAELREGSLYGHFRSILINQIDSTKNYGFGGSIKSWDSPVSLLSSLLMQKDFDPIALIDFAKREYENSLNNLSEVYFTNILKYIQSANKISDGIDAAEVTDFILKIVSEDTKVKTVFNDTSSGVVGFPISLAKMGFVSKQQPKKIFDGELSAWFLQHHDGHLNTAYINDNEFLDLLFEKRVKAVYPGLISDFQNTEPTPFKGKVWRYTEDRQNKIKVFCVEISSPSQPQLRGADGAILWSDGDVWHEQGSNKIYKFDSGSNKWNLTTLPHTNFWMAVDFAELLNQVILHVESKLYDSIDEFKTPIINLETWQDLPFVDLLQEELAAWAFANKLDPTDSNFNAKNAFTWNYKNAIVPGISSPKSSWSELLKQHHSTVSGVVPTSRPDLYPWKLLGFNDKPTNWDEQFASTTPGTFVKISYAKVAETNPTAEIFGTRIIDNVMIKTGDVVLVTENFVQSRNGLWVVSDSNWTRLTVSQNEKIVISSGFEMVGSEWFIQNDIPAQIRMWSTQMWDYIKSQRQTLKLSVNKITDQLLPPYVNPALSVSNEALITTIPTGITLPFIFGDKSPVELIWMKSIDFGYSIAKALFRYDPLLFIQQLWGLNYVYAGGIPLEIGMRRMFSISGCSKHGDAVYSTRNKFISFDSISAVNSKIEFIMVGTKAGTQVFKMMIDGISVGFIYEGQAAQFSNENTQIVNLKIEDFGVPFNVNDKIVLLFSNNGASMTKSFISTKSVEINGFAQLFSQMLRSNSIDTSIGYANSAMYNWTPHIGYRVGGYVTNQDLQISTSLDTIPQSAFALVSKKTGNLKSSWITALKVSTIQVGKNSLRKNNSYTPNGVGDDWVFRIDGYNQFGLTVNFHVFNKNGHFNTFNAIEKSHTEIDWKQFTEVLETQTVTLPITIIGIQNVLNFVFGYESYLKSIGWNFDKKVPENAEHATGRYLDFQFLLEKFIDGIYAGGNVGRGEVLNPIAAGVWIDHDRGVLSSFSNTGIFNPVNDSAAYDMFGVRIKNKDLYINRSKASSLISSNMPIFSIHAEFDSYEHLVVFNNYMNPIEQTGTLYEPFQGSIVSFIKFNGMKQAASTLRPEVGGYVLNNGNMVRNVESSIQTIGKMYDASSVFEDQNVSDHALSLYGYSKKSYMDDMDYTDKTQFNFWRGMVHMKGTNMSFDAFKNGNRFDDARLDEYWAFKIADYGDARVKKSPEIILKDSDCQQQFTKITLNGRLDETFVQVSSTDESRWVDETINNFNTTVSKTNNFDVLISDVENSTIFQFENTGDFVSFSSNLTKLNHTSFIATAPGTAFVSYSAIDVNKHSPMTLINFAESAVVQKIPVWHPAVGLHNPFVLPHIDVISDINPALYNYSTIIKGNTNFDPFRKWGKNQVGLIWFDTSNAIYMDYNSEDLTVADKLNRWGSLVEYGTINVSEWVESSVHPAEYEILSKSTDQSIKTDGIPYGAKIYKRDRIWEISPIAWSKSGVPIESAHPAFNAAYYAALNFRSNGVVSVETSTFADMGVVPGMRIGAWRDDLEFTGPLNEFIILANSNSKFFMEGSNEFYNKTILVDGVELSVEFGMQEYTDVNGLMEFTFDSLLDVIENPILTFEGVPTGNSNYQINLKVFYNNNYAGIAILGSTTATSGVEPEISFLANQQLTISMPKGITMTITVNSNLTCSFSEIAQALELEFFNGITIEDAVLVEDVTFNGLEPTLELPFPSTLTNDPEDPRTLSNFGCGWRAWNVPSQAELDADAEQPNSTWKPYIGVSKVLANPTLAIINDAINNDSITLNDGTKISRYSTTWSDWEEVRDEVNSVISLGGDVQINLTQKYDTSRMFVYKNGIRQFPGSFLVYGSIIIVPETSAGDKIFVKISKYEPSADELSFKPEVLDDLKKQVQYKKDYEFVEFDVRNDEGAFQSKLYYFWVTNKTNSSDGLPTNTITESLLTGPSQFVLFPRNDSFAVFGLNYLVAKNNTFKLRLLSDETLRDDPNGLDLKDTHQEWTLIRQGQRGRVPKELWDRIVDSMCGQNLSGQSLPFQSIIEYDNRNGTNTIYGFNEGQILAPRDVLVNTAFQTITNSKVTIEFDLSGTIDFISSEVLDWENSNYWFDTPEHTRTTMERIWQLAKPSQINEIVFSIINDICAFNSEMTHLMKTSRLSAYSIKIVQQSSGKEEFE